MLRKSESGDFEKIFTELAINQTGIHQYNFTDRLPLNGNNYYQLKQNDLDGKSTLSDIVTVKIGFSEDRKLLVYPNPATDLITINHSLTHDKSAIKIIDVQGKVVLNSLLRANQFETKLNISAIINGIYTLVFINDNQQQSINIIKQ